MLHKNGNNVPYFDIFGDESIQQKYHNIYL